MKFNHKPVLLKETIEYLNCQPGGVYVDGTLGGGGHTEAIVKEINDEGLVIGIDRDKKAIKAADKRLKEFKSVKLIHGNYIEIPEILSKLNLDKVSGMLFDLGVSSPQFDNPERGFSYRYDAPLDMRMNQEQSFTARDIVNKYSERDLTKIIKKYGEERWASRIASFIVERRKNKPIETTFDLVDIIKAAIPAGARRKGGHPARRTFQAFRIATNNELEQLEKMIERVIPYIKKGGRLCIISFHSLEDRIVKQSFKELAKDCVCPPDFPVCVCDKIQKVKILTRKPVEASSEEKENNPRARSAKLRVAQVLN